MRSKGLKPVALALAATAGLTAGVVQSVPAAASEPPTSDVVVATDKGHVRGAVEDGSRVFQGIPYAAPPVGELRWHEPRPAEGWSGVRDATEAGPACAQLPGELPDGSHSEDCLYLNVTAPADPAGGPKPVVVWVHGGGNFMGAGSNYGAQRMVNRGDVVVVTPNYRLGVFGFFGHPGLAGSGTFGLRDQQAALRWVQRNITAFGGDPGNVTLAGQSAGAMSACAHLTSPAAAGLFDKVITQSGSCEFGWLDNFDYRGQAEARIFQPRQAVQEHGRAVAADLGCDDADPDAALECLRQLPVADLMAVHQSFIQPAYGTRTLPLDPAFAVRRGLFHRVPVLSGHTSNETTSYTSVYEQGEPMSDETYREVLAETFGDDAAAVTAQYPRSDYDSAAQAWAAITTDRSWACTQIDTSRHLAQRVPVYQYEFADPNPPSLSPAPPPFPLGATHASELWSLFDLGGYAPSFTAEQQRLSEQMIDYWTSFATTGDPGGQGPAWPRFRPSEQPAYVQSLAPGEGGIGPVDGAAEHHCEFWSSLSSWRL